MQYKLIFTSILPLILFLALAPAASACSTWYVDGVNGSDGNDCLSSQSACKTIGHTISLAKSGDSIMVAPATYTENLTIGFSLKVIGSGASTTIIDGGGVNSGVLISNANAHVTLSKVTISNGAALFGGGIDNEGGTLTINRSTISGNTSDFLRGGGGGIYNHGGTLTVNNSTISGNGSQIGGGIFNYIDNYGSTATINNSTISGNTAYAAGGGIYNGRTLTINNSTISGNRAVNAWGGGIFNPLGTATINNSTVSGNSAPDSYYGGIFNDDVVTLQNSIVANSTGGGNCGGTVTSRGYNLSSDGTCDFNNTGDMNNTDPKLGPLQNYGGPTLTMKLPRGSPATDAGNPNGCTDGNGNLLKTDQRGFRRPDKEATGGCDIGAYERQTD